MEIATRISANVPRNQGTQRDPTDGHPGRLIIRNLAFKAAEKHLRKVFEPVGDLANVHLPEKKEGGQFGHRGFAFVQFARVEDASRAVKKLSGTKVLGREITVDWASKHSDWQA